VQRERNEQSIAKHASTTYLSIMTTTFPPMPLLPVTSPSTISACRNLPLRPSDIFICSYPKSGTTWTQHIVLTLLLADDRKYKIAASTDNNSTAASTTDDDIAYNHVSPFFEIDAHWQSSPSNDSTKVLAESVRKNHDRLRRRVFNTHLRWDMLPKQREVAHNKKTTMLGAMAIQYQQLITTAPFTKSVLLNAESSSTLHEIK